MPAGDTLAEAIVGAEMRADMLDEKRASLALAGARDAHLPAVPTSEAGTELENFPTAEELATLRRVPNKFPLKVFTIAFIELCERFSYYGCITVFTNFIHQPLPPGSKTGADPEQAGALGMGQQAAVGITTFNQFWQYFVPLFGAFVADQYWGRYKTISVALGVDIFGHIILLLSALPPIIVNKDGALSCLILGILVIGFGTGGFKPNISCLIMEQLGEQHLHVKTLKSGERVIVDPAVTTERIYNFFYFFINTGALVGQLGMAYAERDIGFWLSFTLPTILLCFGPLVMLWGRKRYVRREPGGSVLIPAMRTFFLAQKGRWSINPFATWKNMHDGTFWNNVKPSRFTEETRPKWMTFDDAWVDELGRGFAACAVFCYYPIYWLCYNQINNNLISQAATMQRHGVPNDVLANLNPFSLLFFIPVNNFFIFPALRKAGIKISPIRKIATGFFLGCAAMIWAAIVQYYIYQKSECGYQAGGQIWDGTAENEEGGMGAFVLCPEAPINVWAQTGSYVLIALSEVFASITSLEYAYNKAPKNMRSRVQAVALFMTAFAAALGQAFVPLAKDPLLIWNYAVVAILAFIAGSLFFIQFRDLDQHEDELNSLPEGVLGANAFDAKTHDVEGTSEPYPQEKRAAPVPIDN